MRGNPSQFQRLILPSWWSCWKCPAPGDFGAREVTRGQDAPGRPLNLNGKPHLRAAGPAGGELFYGLSLCPRSFPPVLEMLEAGCACPKSCGRLFLQHDAILGPAGMGKYACLSGKRLKEGEEEKTGISSEPQQQVGTQRDTEARESGLMGWGETGQLKCMCQRHGCTTVPDPLL